MKLFGTPGNAWEHPGTLLERQHSWQEDKDQRLMASKGAGVPKNKKECASKQVIVEGFITYLEVKNYRRVTIYNILKVVKSYQDHLSGGGSLEGYLQGLERCAIGTYNHAVYGLRVYFGWRSCLGLPVAGGSLRYRRLSRPGPVEVLSLSEAQGLLAAAEGFGEQALLCGLYLLGMRAGEVVAWQWADIDWALGLVRVCQSKTGRARGIPMSRGARSLLWAHWQAEGPLEGPVLVGRFGGPMQVGSLGNRLKRIVGRADLAKRVYPHLLRHSIATHLLEAGMGLWEVGYFLGHQDVQSTVRYTHIGHGARPV